MKNIFIPENILVGYRPYHETHYQNDNPALDTSEKLGMKMGGITYREDAKKIKCGITWKRWRNDGIPASDFQNKPKDRFELLDWGNSVSCPASNGNNVRFHVQDPRGFVFEITPQNLWYIIKNRGLTGTELNGDYIYGFHNGKVSMLIPVGSQLHEDGKEFTKCQHIEFEEKDMIPGYVYEIKSGDKFLYLGKYDWYQRTDKEDPQTHEWMSGYSKTKRYLFVAYQMTWHKDPAIPAEASLMPVTYYMQLQNWVNIKRIAKKLHEIDVSIQSYFRKKLDEEKHLYAPVKLVADPVHIQWQIGTAHPANAYSELYMESPANPGEYEQFNVVTRHENYNSRDQSNARYDLQLMSTCGLRPQKDKFPVPWKQGYNHTREIRERDLSKSQLEQKNFVKLHVELSNGMKVPFNQVF